MKIIELPVLPLRDVVAFPGMTLPLFVGRHRSIQSLNSANGYIFLLAQKDSLIEDPFLDDMYQVGIIAKIKQSIVLPDKTVKILVEGESKAKIIEIIEENGILSGKIEIIENLQSQEQNIDLIALRKMLCSTFDQYMKIQKKFSAELFGYIESIEDSFKLTYIIATHMELKTAFKQKILEENDEKNIIETMIALIEGEIEIFQAERRIRTRVKSQIEKNQKEYYLNEQMKAIQRELGEADDFKEEIRALEQKLETIQISKSSYTKAKTEIKKLKYMNPFSAESAIVRTYLDFLINLPWGKYTKIVTDVNLVKNNLENSHYGMQKAKERLYELIIQRKRVKDIARAPVLCFYGAPGTGKTSLAQSAGEAMGLKTMRIPLGGVRDEAVLRGHRRTYIGAMPGKIMQAIKDAQSSNLLIIFDEIGAMGYDHHKGNLEDVLLEVFDPLQNKSFQDHYLEEGFDLSHVTFMATTNTLDLKEPLLDRLEIIEISGYTQEEKQKIARNYIIPRLLKEYGIKTEEFNITDQQIDVIVKEYTYESGVRGLEQNLAKLIRKTMCYLEENTNINEITIDQEFIKKFLGHPTYTQEITLLTPQIGIATGLAYVKKREGQEGEVLYIEAKIVPGDGKIECTGRLGEVMKESAQVAFKYLLANAEKYEINLEKLQKQNIHIHLPAGAVPKDGPSAGIALFCAMLSAIKEIPIRNDIAITGEISLYKILPVGGIKEKILAAYRRNPKINTVFIPYNNRNDLDDVPNYVKNNMQIILVKSIDEIIKEIFVTTP